MYEKIIELAEGMRQELAERRRDLHRYPETGWMEMRTSSLIAAELKKLGYEVLTGEAVCRSDARMGLPAPEALDAHYRWAEANGADPEFLPDTKGGHTGVIGILRCGEGPVVAMRFDIDALPVQEERREGRVPCEQDFCSTVDGSMHACGHDGHMTIGLGTAKLLARMRERLSGTVKLIFQPAEEGVRGAKSIVENGHLDDVDYLLGSHLSASVDGSCYVCPGMAGTLATTKLDATFSGKSAHAGVCPQDGANALLAAAAAVLNLQAIPRHGDGASQINVGVLHAGTGRNIICDRARLELEVRGKTTAINEYMEAYARRILHSAAAMHGCTLELTQVGGAASIQCSDELTNLVRDVCGHSLGFSVRTPTPMGGSEDFAYMTKRVIDLGKQACFTGIHIPCAAPFHNTGFDFDERALVMGVKMYSGIARRLLVD